MFCSAYNQRIGQQVPETCDGRLNLMEGFQTNGVIRVCMNNVNTKEKEEIVQTYL